jgi:predicted permease
MRNLLHDVRFGLRVLQANPGFAIAAAITLGLGIASTTTAFSWIDTMLLHPYPGTHGGGELAALEMVTPSAPNGGTSISWLDYLDYRDRLQSVSGLAVRRQCAFTLDDVQLTWGELVSDNYFEAMGAQAAQGQLFTRRPDDSLGTHAVAVISSRLWREYFHSDPAIAGRTIRVNRRPLTIAGVVKDEFRGGSPIMRYDLWIPVTMGPALGSIPEAAFRDRGSRGSLTAIARLRSGVPMERARAEVKALAASVEAANPASNRGVGATLLHAWQEHNGVNELLRAPLAILLAFSFVVLLIVCANVSNLLLARSTGRQREFGIRIALGAGRSRVGAQVLIETLLIAVAGGGFAILILSWMQGTLIGMAPNVGIPISATLAWNGRILGFTALACIAAALLAGISPALVVFHVNLNEAMKDGSRGDTAGSASRRTRGALVIGEVALATVALIGAGLFLKSFHGLRAVEPGFDSEKVLLGRFFIETAGFDGAQIRDFTRRLRDRLAATAGIEGASYSDFVPLSTTAGPYNNVRVDGYTPSDGESMALNRALISPGYFSTMGLPLLEGRDFTPLDSVQSDPVMVVNETFAKRYFNGQPALGRRVRVNGQWCTIVGLAKDSKYFSPAEGPAPHFYLAFDQFYRGSPELYFLIRTQGKPALAIPALRQAALDTDPAGAAFHAVPLQDYIQVSTFGQAVAANLMALLGMLCLVLAASGLYSVLSYAVSQRIPEIGIRMAMGASPRDVIAMVVGQGMRLALAGIALGAIGALAGARLLSGMLYGVDAADPAVFAMAGLFLALISLGAAWLPAFRATRADPMLTLRG